MAGKGWTDKSEYKELKRELRALSRDAFADRVLELLRIRWPECMTAPRLKAIDRKGVDLFVWDELAVQCKGFEVDEARLGRSQIDQCLASIEKFRRSDVGAERYLLIHNRDGSDEGFRVEVGKAVEALAAGGRVERAELWDVQRLLREVFNGMSDRITDALAVAANRNVAAFGAFDPEPLPVVPLRLSNLTIDRHRLESEEPAVEMLADPAELLLTSGGPHLTLLIGEAGYGKTTAARRAFRSATQKVFFIPAARIDNRVVGTKDLLDRCIDLEELLEIADVGDSPLWKFVARPVLENLFKDPTTNAVLLFDGLDESPFFARERGAFQHFFNFFNLLKVPVVFTARTEFWTTRKHDLEQRFGKVGEHKGGIRKHVRQIELREWDQPQMVALARRHRESLDGDAARARIDELIRLIESGSYATYYGDIPRRPLFLRMILETVSERDIHYVSRADLVEEWAMQKVARDVEESQRWGTSGRPPIAGETTKRDTIALAFQVMEAAAKAMFRYTGAAMYYLPDCEIQAIAEQVPSVAALSDYTGLVLNTLLVPVDNAVTQRPRVRFAHLLFQDYFLARYFMAHLEELQVVPFVPKETVLFLSDMQQR